MCAKVGGSSQKLKSWSLLRSERILQLLAVGNLVIIYWGSLAFPSPEHYFELATKYLQLDKDGCSFLEQHLITFSQECHLKNWKMQFFILGREGKFDKKGCLIMNKTKKVVISKRMNYIFRILG